MTLTQIEDEIRSLTLKERIELYKWLDYFVVADCGVDTDFRSRIGADRSLAVRAGNRPKGEDQRQEHPDEGPASRESLRGSNAGSIATP
jgi:hypothetical protein